LLVGERVVLGRLELVALGALVSVAAWTVLSAVWSVEPSASLREGERAFVYVAGLAAVLLVAGQRSLGVLLGGVLVAISAVCCYGLGDYLLGGRRVDPYEGTALFRPLGYANAFAALAAVGVLLAIGFARRRRLRERALAAVPAALGLATIALTRSRGGWLALAVGVVVPFALERRRLRRCLPGLVALAVAGALGLGVVGSLGGNRPAYWRVAWREFGAHPLEGSGAGTFDWYWVREGTAAESVQDAHSLYVETLGELGLVGLVLVAAALAVPLVAAAAAPASPLVSGAAGAYAACVVHAALDWDWEMPAVTLAAVVCGGALLVANRGRRVSGR
jgi:O-antigen ligase